MIFKILFYMKFCIYLLSSYKGCNLDCRSKMNLINTERFDVVYGSLWWNIVLCLAIIDCLFLDFLNSRSEDCATFEHRDVLPKNNAILASIYMYTRILFVSLEQVKPLWTVCSTPMPSDQKMGCSPPLLWIGNSVFALPLKGPPT